MARSRPTERGIVLPEKEPRRTIQLNDGRLLGFAEYGDPEGKPLLHFHGFRGSRFERHPDGSIARALGVRVVTVDRPGTGLSSPKPSRKLLDWPRDVLELTEALGIGRFAVSGYSWGAPHALACAHEIPERLSVVGLVSGFYGRLVGPGAATDVGSEFKMIAHVARFAPLTMRSFLGRSARRFQRNPERAVEKRISELSPPDRAAVNELGLREMMLRVGTETFRQDEAGLYEDTMAVVRPWGFRLEDVGLPVRLWHGEQDGSVHSQMARRAVAKIPGCEALFYPGEGHLLIFTHWEDILRSLTPG